MFLYIESLLIKSRSLIQVVNELDERVFVGVADKKKATPTPLPAIRSGESLFLPLEVAGKHGAAIHVKLDRKK